MGIFTNLDNWFMDRVHSIVTWSPEEQKLNDELNPINVKIQVARKAVEKFNKYKNGKKRSRLVNKWN
jgi:hypothetical protein